MTIKEVAKMFNVNTEKSRAMKNKRKAKEIMEKGIAYHELFEGVDFKNYDASLYNKNEKRGDYYDEKNCNINFK